MSESNITAIKTPVTYYPTGDDHPIIDANGSLLAYVQVFVQDVGKRKAFGQQIAAAINETASLRTERDDLRSVLEDVVKEANNAFNYISIQLDNFRGEPMASCDAVAIQTRDKIAELLEKLKG